MSGHSKWATIKHKKGLKDAKRGALFTKLAKDITIVASEGGGDLDMNFSLRLAIDKAKQANMPKENIQRAIDRGTGAIKGEEITKQSYEAYSSNGKALIVDTTTDNTNRTVAEVKRILESFGAKIAEPGSVAWQFEEKGVIVIRPVLKASEDKFIKSQEEKRVDPEEISLEIMEIEGVEDVNIQGDKIEILLTKESFKKVHDEIERKNLVVESAEIVKIAKDKVEADEEEKSSLESLIDSLEEHDDVNTVWTNVLTD